MSKLKAYPHGRTFVHIVSIRLFLGPLLPSVKLETLIIEGTDQYTAIRSAEEVKFGHTYQERLEIYFEVANSSDSLRQCSEGLRVTNLFEYLFFEEGTSWEYQKPLCSPSILLLTASDMQSENRVFHGTPNREMFPRTALTYDGKTINLQGRMHPQSAYLEVMNCCSREARRKPTFCALVIFSHPIARLCPSVMSLFVRALTKIGQSVRHHLERNAGPDIYGSS